MILIFLTIFIVIIFLTLKVSSKLGYRKLGITIVISIALIFLLIPLNFLYDDIFFFKSDAKKKLEEHNIILNENFDLKNKSISGVMDRELQFELTISEKDKEEIIKKFKNSPYRSLNNTNEIYDIESKIKNSLKRDTILYSIYEENGFWYLEYCKILSNGYIQTRDMIQVSKNNNELYFTRKE